jgi:hypothetical protein
MHVRSAVISEPVRSSGFRYGLLGKTTDVSAPFHYRNGESEGPSESRHLANGNRLLESGMDAECRLNLE